MISTTKTRREFLSTGSAALAGMQVGQLPVGAAPRQATSVKVLNPRLRVPLSFIIDDSTCLVNMGRYCMPQFATVYPDRDSYKKPWKNWPHEIPDSFVREFGQWCASHGVKGKYSIVPYPACVGWLDRELPGWSRRQLQDSLKLVRELMVPNWDIHPEMITHTRVIDLKTGRPLEEISPATMENSYPRVKKSVDELASYLAYALRILKNCDLPCEGVTTPGGFGNLVKSELSLAVHESVRDVFGSELPHYFKYVVNGEESTEPKLEHVRSLDSSDPKVTVNVPACTGDWFGGWDGDRQSEGDRYANQNATAGRMVELIKRGEPAVMLCHWPGMYTHGTKQGFAAFKKVVLALEARYNKQTIWMKISEIARYWAAKKLTRIEQTGQKITFQAPFGTPRFTVRAPLPVTAVPKLTIQGRNVPLESVTQTHLLKAGKWIRDREGVVTCFDLPRGLSHLSW